MKPRCRPIRALVLLTLLGGTLGFAQTSSVNLRNSTDESLLLVTETGRTRIGIGSDTSASLTLFGYDGLLSYGLFGSGTPYSLGAGTRLQWYPIKSAFRAGYVSADQWDDANIGEFSIALGRNTLASGLSSLALGAITTASGEYATALGRGTKATGNYSFAMGRGIEATGMYSVGIALGYQVGTVLSQDSTMAIMGGRVGIGTVTPTTGLEVTDTIYASAGGFKFPDGTVQTTAATGGSGGNTLDQAYDQGGAGAGRIITADAGALEVGGVDGVVFKGTYDSGTIPATGAGTRMMWYPRKAAFRAGWVSGEEWDDANIGVSSTAMGQSTTASGSSSTAMGLGTTASGHNSTAMGYGSGASGAHSTAMGYATTASGTYSTAMGYRTTANIDGSTAIGYNATASGLSSTAMGTGTTASGDYSTALGQGTHASGNVSTAMGHSTTASGTYSTAMGVFTKAKAFASVAIGRYNDSSGTADSWVNTDPLFVIGNGTSSNARSNAMTVLKDGKVGIGTISPLTRLHVADTIYSSFGGFRFPDGTVQTTAGGGGSKWLGGTDIYYNTGNVGIGSSVPLTELHIKKSDISLPSGALSNDVIAVEDADAGIGFYSSDVGNYGSFLSMGEIVSGALRNKWSVYRTTSIANPANQLRISFGTNANYAANTALMSISENGRVGIGTTAPSARLHVADTIYSSFGGFKFPDGTVQTTASTGGGGGITLDQAYDQGGTGAGRTITADAGAVTVAGTDGFLSTGTHGSGTIPASGAGTRMMWYPGKAAFRVGTVNSYNPDFWDNDSIGEYSFASGIDARATGFASTAMGNGTSASHDGATALGGGAQALGHSSTAMGNGTIASGPASTAFGNGSIASGSTSTALGYDTKATGSNAIAMGWLTEARGNNSTAMGNLTIAEGFASTAIGFQTRALGNHSFASGNGTYAPGLAAFATGNATHANGKHSVATGESSFATGENSVAMGNDAHAEGRASVALGTSSRAEGDYSIAMGYDATASGHYSLAAGTRVSTDGYNGSFILGDSSASGTTESNAANQMTMRFSGGYRLYSNSGLTAGVTLPAGGGSWTSISDERKKENFKTEDGDMILSKIASISVPSWNYKSQSTSIRHLGPMAQDFFAAFGFGESDTTITSTDIDGINLLAIQALEKRTRELAEKTAEVGTLREKVSSLEQENAHLRSRLCRVEAAIKQLTISYSSSR